MYRSPVLNRLLSVEFGLELLVFCMVEVCFGFLLGQFFPEVSIVLLKQYQPWILQIVRVLVLTVVLNQDGRGSSQVAVKPVLLLD